MRLPVDTPLALFEINRISRKVPMDQAVAPGMEIEPLLPDRRTGEQEGPKRAVERISDGVLADVLAVIRAAVAEAQCEHGANTEFLTVDASSGCPSLGPKELPVDTSARRMHHLDELSSALPGGLVGVGVFGPRLLVPEHVPLFVEHRLQIAVLAIAEHETPVGRLIPRSGSRGQLA